MLFVTIGSRCIVRDSLYAFLSSVGHYAPPIQLVA